MNCVTSMPSHHTSQPRPQAPSVGLSQSSSTKRMSCSIGSMPMRAEALQVEILEVRRRRLHDHLELVVVLQPVGVLAVAAILGPARGLHVGGVPGLGAERAQGGGRMEGAGAHLHVVGLQDDAALLAPELLQASGSGPGTSSCGRRPGEALATCPVCRLGGFLLHGSCVSGVAARALYANGGIGHLDFTARARGRRRSRGHVLVRNHAVYRAQQARSRSADRLTRAECCQPSNCRAKASRPDAARGARVHCGPS